MFYTKTPFSIITRSTGCPSLLPGLFEIFMAIFL